MNEKKGKGEGVTKKIKTSTLVISIFAFILLFLLVFSLVVYRFDDSVKLPTFVSKNIFLPAVIINKTNFISIGDVKRNLSSIKSFYEKQDFSSVGVRFDFSTADGKKRLKIRERELLNKMIEDKMIEILAKQNGIRVSDKSVDENVSRKLNEYGNEREVSDSLYKLYGWSLDDFKEKVVKPSIYKDELEKWLEKNDGKEKKDSSYEKATEASGELKSGTDFDSLAKKISEGGTSDSGGKLGWFQEDQISVDIRGAVADLKVGETSDVLESKLGYHIVKLNEIRDADNTKSYNISQIFFPKMSFAIWLDEKIKDSSIYVPMLDYSWNSEEGLVEFDNNEMKKFEEKSLNDTQRDASLLTL